VNERGDIASAVRGCRDVAAELWGKRRPPGLSVPVVNAGGKIWGEGFGLGSTEASSYGMVSTDFVYREEWRRAPLRAITLDSASRRRCRV
jgi:hypothetical protein